MVSALTIKLSGYRICIEHVIILCHFRICMVGSPCFSLVARSDHVVERPSALQPCGLAALEQIGTKDHPKKNKDNVYWY